MRNQSDEELSFKIILIGDQGVGKSSILTRYIKNEFLSDYNVTIGVEFTSRDIDIDNETRIKLQIWDTAGQESFRAIVRSFYRNASAVFLIYQINRRETFSSIASWLDEVRENASPNIILALMGNQSDREDREVSFEEGERFMKENNLHFFFETSAKDGTQINQAFQEASKMIFLNYIKEIEESAMITDFSDNSQQQQHTYKKLSSTDSIETPQSKRCC